MPISPPCFRVLTHDSKYFTGLAQVRMADFCWPRTRFVGMEPPPPYELRNPDCITSMATIRNGLRLSVWDEKNKASLLWTSSVQGRGSISAAKKRELQVGVCRTAAYEQGTVKLQNLSLFVTAYSQRRNWASDEQGSGQQKQPVMIEDEWFRGRCIKGLFPLRDSIQVLYIFCDM